MSVIVRETRETRVRVQIERGRGRAKVATGEPFLDHMLTTLARYSGLDLTVTAKGDLRHHLIEDVAITLGADKSYDAADFVEELRTLNVRPHVAQNLSGRRSAIDKRTTRHPGYAASQRIRKRIEEAFGWIKTVAGLRQTKLRGRAKIAWAFTFAVAAYNLVRAPTLLAAAP